MSFWCNAVMYEPPSPIKYNTRKVSSVYHRALFNDSTIASRLDFSVFFCCACVVYRFLRCKTEQLMWFGVEQEVKDGLMEIVRWSFCLDSCVACFAHLLSIYC